MAASRRRSVLIRDQRRGMLLGLALTVAGAYCLWDAHEARGRDRPFVLRFLNVLP